MKFREILAEHHPKLKQKYDSEQFRYSEMLIMIKLNNKLSQLDMSRLAEIEYDKYLEMESCSLKYSTEEYADIVNLIKSKVN